MKIDSANYEITADAKTLSIKLKTDYIEGRHVKDLKMDLDAAISYRGQEIDRIELASRVDAEGRPL